MGIPSDVMFLAEQLAETYRERGEERAYLKDPRALAELACGNTNPTFARSDLSRDLALYYRRKAVEAEPRADQQYWLEKAKKQ